MSHSFGTLSICICTSSTIQTNEICLLCISSITICILCICTIASSHFVKLKVLFLSYCRFCICTIVSSLFVLLKVLYLSYCKFCICIIANTNLLDLNPWRRASASPLIQLFTKSLGTPGRFSIVTFLCMYCKRDNWKA